MTNSVIPSFPNWHDDDGSGLNSGYIYVGQPNLDAETHPVTVYTDAALTSPIDQPLRTIGGRITYNGSPIQVYVDGDYSLTVRRSSGELVYSSQSITARDDLLLSGVELVHYATVADLLASTEASRGTGSTWWGGGYRYEETAGGSDLLTAGGVNLMVLPLNGAYNWGAWAQVDEGDDVTSVLKTALEAVYEKRNAEIVGPGGHYIMGNLCDTYFPSSGSGSPVHYITIDFAGCTFECPDTNTTGGLKITTYNNFQQLRIKNLFIQSAAPIGISSDPTNGTGLHLYSALRPGDAGWGTTEAAQAVLENVNIVSKAPANFGRWDNGIILDGFWFPEMFNCFVTTRHPGNDTDQLYESGDGILCLNCYSPRFSECYSLGRFTHNIRVDEDADFGYEDFQLTGCYAIGGRDALAVRMSSLAKQTQTNKEPGGRVSGGHYNGHRRAISVEYRSQFTIEGALLYLTIGAGRFEYASAAFIYLNDCQGALVKGNNIPEGGHYVSDADCSRHVQFDGNTTGVQVQGNAFGAEGIAIANTSTGTNNFVQGNTYTSYIGPGPTKRIVNGGSAADLTGGDVHTSIEPSISFGGGSTGVTYTSRDGGYVKNNLTVTWWIDIRLSSKGTDTGDANIVTGLPAPRSGSDFGAVVSFSAGSAQAPQGGIINSSGEIELYAEGTNDNFNIRIQDTDINNATELRMSGSYLAAE